jgi:hypothetical protein
MRILHYLLFIAAALTAGATGPSAAFTTLPEDRIPNPPQVRSPENVPGIPGQWPQQGKHKIVDATQLKAEAQALQTLSQQLTPQIDQIGHGQLPTELIDSLKKIEKLAKHIRGEIS